MRDPARTPPAAQARYVRVLQRSLSCISKAIWVVGPSNAGTDRKLTLSEEAIRLRTADGQTLWLRASQLFELIPHPEFEGEWKSSTRAYVYELGLEDDNDGLIGWHWHPNTTPDRPLAHTHVRIEHPPLGVSLPRLHIPSGRVSFEEVARFSIVELNVVPVRSDWDEILAESFLRFRTYRSWG